MSKRRSLSVALRSWSLGVAAAFMALILFGGWSLGRAAVQYDDLALFASVLDLVRQNYVSEVDEHELMQSALHGLLRELDPHSSYMDPKDFDEMQVDTRGEFHGLGIEVTKAKDRYIEVVSPIEGTPAFRAGVKPRDQITVICPTVVPENWGADETCRETQDMNLVEAVSLMRGELGTEITIYLWREGFEEPRPFKIRRDVVKMASVEGATLSPGYVHLNVRAFQERTQVELAKELAKLHEENQEGLKGMVIDLRDNPGGLLNQAVAMADYWIDDGLIVYTQGRDASQREDYRSQAGMDEPDYPIVVLVNAGSASASEIVAGALQDHGRGLVMGTRTFGKGSVQTVYPLEGGAGLRLTTALYYTPSGRSIQEVGIEPDIEVHPNSPSEGVLMRRLREADLRGHLTHGQASPGSESGSTPPEPSASGQENASEEGEVEAQETEEEDVLLSRALEVLKSWSYFDQLSEQRNQKAAALTVPADEAVDEGPPPAAESQGE